MALLLGTTLVLQSRPSWPENVRAQYCTHQLSSRRSRIREQLGRSTSHMTLASRWSRIESNTHSGKSNRAGLARAADAGSMMQTGRGFSFFSA